MNDASRPPRIGTTSGSLSLGLGLCALALVGCLDVGGALSSALSNGPGHLVSLVVMGKVLAHLVKHPGAPALAWPAADGLRFVPATFWGVSGLLVLALGLLVRVVVRLERGAGGGTANAGGFAPLAALSRVATVRAACRRARQTRPALVATLPRVLGRPLLSRLPAGEVGYPLGITREPRRVTLVANWETSLRLVAPPGEGKTERVMKPIGRSHPGPLFATSTKSDLYEGILAEREARGPVWALDPDGLRARRQAGAVVAGGGVRVDEGSRAPRRGADRRRRRYDGRQVGRVLPQLREDGAHRLCSMRQRSAAARWPTWSPGRRTRPTRSRSRSSAGKAKAGSTGARACRAIRPARR